MENSTPILNKYCIILFLLRYIMLVMYSFFTDEFYRHKTNHINPQATNVIYIYIYIYGAPIHDVSRAHTTTQHSRQDSSGRVISSSQRPLPDNTRQSKHTNIHAPGGIRTHDLSIFFCCECRVLSGRGLCDKLITRPEESYRLCCVVVCALETSRMGAPYMYDISHLRVKLCVPWLRRIVTCLSTLLFFFPLPVHIRYLVVKLSQVQVFTLALCFSPVSFHQSSIIISVILFNTTFFGRTSGRSLGIFKQSSALLTWRSD